MRLYANIVLLLLCLAVAGTGEAATYYIKADGTGDYPDLQTAMAAAVNGDVLLLAAGTYTGPGNREVDFAGKAVTIISESGPEMTTIDLEKAGRAFVMSSGEGSGSVLSGLTVINGYATIDGGVLVCEGPGSSPTIEHCIFRGNSAYLTGGVAFFRQNSRATITDCVFEGNGTQWGHAGAVMFYDWNSNAPTITGCTFIGNSSGMAPPGALGVAGGGAVVTDCVFLNNSSPDHSGALNGGNFLITGCVFAGNTAPGGGNAVGSWGGTISNCTIYGGYYPSVQCAAGTTVIESTIIAFNKYGSAVGCGGGAVTLICSDLFGNAGGDWVGCIAGQLGVNGNICLDPLFCESVNPLDPYTLDVASPCAAVNSPCGRIGARDCACSGPVGTEEATLGKVKTLYWQ